MTILETFIKLRDDLKTWVTNNLNQKANISYVDEKFDSISEFDPTEIQEAIDANTAAIDTKVDKVDGMGLSTNDYTTAEKDKLTGIEDGATNTIDWFDTGISIEAGSDLDTYTTIGKYYVKSGAVVKSLINAPEGLVDNFSMYVFRRTISRAICQMLITINGGLFIRGTSESGDFRNWKKKVNADDLTGFATETYVNDQIALLVDSAPDTLNTLNELSVALGDDHNFAATIATQLGGKVDKVEGKGLSSNDYTDTEKDKLDAIEANANFYEHPTHASHSSGLYKVTVDESGHVSGATLAEKEDIVVLGIPAQDTTYDEEIEGLSGRLDDVENSINTTNETLEGVAQEFENYKTTNNEAVSTNASGIETNKTAIEVIQGDYLTSTDKTQLQDDISKVSEKATANASAIEILNGEGDGSVKQSIDNAFNEFATNVTNDDVVNTYKELIDYAATHGPEFTELVGKVDTINTNVGEIETDVSNYKAEISERFTETDTTINNHVIDTNNPHGVTKEQLGLENVDNTSDLEKPISNAMQDALDVKADKDEVEGLFAEIDTDIQEILELKSDSDHTHSELYYDKSEIEELIKPEDIDDICGSNVIIDEDVDLISYATKQWVQDGYQPKGNYITEQDISGKLDKNNFIDWFGVGVPISTDDDLDTYKTNGKYYAGSESIAKTLKNRPDGMNTNFCMWVFQRTTANIYTQMIVTLHGRMYVRSSNSSGWKDWVAYTTSAEIESLKVELKQELLNELSDGTGAGSDLDMDGIKAAFPTVEMIATLEDGTTATYKLYGEKVTA